MAKFDKAYIALIVSVVLWATTFAATKISTFEVPPVTLALFRFAIASVILLCLISVKNETSKLKKALSKDWKYFLILGFLGITVMYTLENLAIKLTTTSQAAIIMNIDAILIALLAGFYLKEKISKTSAIGILLGFIGVCLVTFNQLDLTILLNSQSFIGNVLAFASSITWAIYTIMIKKKVKEYGVLTVTGIASLFGTLFLVISTLVFEGIPNVSNFSATSWLTILYLGIAISVVSFYLWNYALKKLDASKVGFYWFLVPIIAVIIGAILFKETITLPMIAGMSLIFLGIYLTEKK